MSLHIRLGIIAIVSAYRCSNVILFKTAVASLAILRESEASGSQLLDQIPDFDWAEDCTDVTINGENEDYSVNTAELYSVRK